MEVELEVGHCLGRRRRLLSCLELLCPLGLCGGALSSLNGCGHLGDKEHEHQNRACVCHLCLCLGWDICGLHIYCWLKGREATTRSL